MRTVAALLLLALGCDHEPPDEPMQCKDILREHPVQLESSLDLLLVVANGAAMGEEQAALADQMRWLVDRLRELPRGLPDLHAAVMSDDGAVLVVPDACPDFSDGESFLSDILVDARTGTREFNFLEELADRLACMARIGAGEEAVEQPLASLAAVVEDERTAFRRPDAALAIAVVTDGEDASPDDVSAYADRVRARAQGPAPVAVSVVSGGPEGCVLDGFTDAAPAPRLAAFVDSFAGGSAVSLCGADPLLGELVEALAALEVGGCIGDEVPSPPECRVSDIRNPGEEGEAEYSIPSCDDAPPPCFAIAPDPIRCAETTSHLRLTLDRGGLPPPDGSSTEASCSVGPECPQ